MVLILFCNGIGLMLFFNILWSIICLINEILELNDLVGDGGEFFFMYVNGV